MTHPSWVAPRAWLSFIELDKAVVQYATGDQWRNNSRKNEGMEPKQKQQQQKNKQQNKTKAVDVTGDRSNI